MDELLDVAKLQLDRRADIVVAHDGGVVADDLQSAVDAAQMVVGELEDEQVFENGFVALSDHLLGKVCFPKLIQFDRGVLALKRYPQRVGRRCV